MVWIAKDNEARGVRTQFPHAIRILENVRIPMEDGTELAATIWLPEGAETHPVPAILEYIPYRKNDFTALRDSLRHPYFAGHGYASVRVDIRGSGDSGGILFDEYLLQEQLDGVAVVEWLAAQPWCSGKVGMIGKSWGGFTGLQVAAHAPEALKAVITLMSTDDRYADDVHYRGGTVLASEMLYWATTMLAYNVRPPDPRFVPNWREEWLKRLEHTPPFIQEWLAHPLKDAYWKNGSINEDYAAITAPVLAVGGWLDGYTNPVFRMLEHLSAPVKAIIGPWVHEYPEVATPQPAIGFLQEALRWWDTWLKDDDQGVMNDPDLRVWIGEWQHPTATIPAEAAGTFVGVTEWPPAAPATAYLHAAPNGLVPEPTTELNVVVDTPLSHGLYGGVWCPFGQPGDLPSDQRHEDALAVTFDAKPAPNPQTVLGFPEVLVDVEADTDEANLIVRLCDVAPDGTSKLVSIGMLALHHSDDHAEVIPIDGIRQQRTITLDAVGYELAPGHTWRVALATQYWPRVWPTPKAPKLRVRGVTLALPIAPAELGSVQFAPPETAPPMGVAMERGGTRTRKVTHDYLANSWNIVEYSDTGLARLLSTGTAFDTVETDTYEIAEGDPLSAKATCERTITLHRDGWDVRIEAVSTMWRGDGGFETRNRVALYLDGELVGERRYD